MPYDPKYYACNRERIIARVRARQIRQKKQRDAAKAAAAVPLPATPPASSDPPARSDPPATSPPDTPVYRGEFRIEPGRYVVTFD